MKKIIIGLVALVVILVGLLTLLSGSGGYSSRDVLTAGSYIYGEDIKESGYMYNLVGPGEITITSGDTEMYYRELVEGESVHEHYIPMTTGDIVEVSGSATLELV